MNVITLNGETRWSSPQAQPYRPTKSFPQGQVHAVQHDQSAGNNRWDHWQAQNRDQPPSRIGVFASLR